MTSTPETRSARGSRSVAFGRAAIGIPLVMAVVWAGVQAASLRNTVEANSRLAATPTAVAIVNVQKVLQKASEASQWQMKLQALLNSAKDEVAARRDALIKLRNEVENTKEPELREAKEQEFALEKLRAEEWAKLREIEVDREKSLMVLSLMRLIRTEAKAVAQSSGYQLVLVDDSTTPLEPDPSINASREAQVLMRAASLRVLYAEESIDITEQVIVRLNNAAATQPADGNAPAPAGGQR